MGYDDVVQQMVPLLIDHYEGIDSPDDADPSIITECILICEQEGVENRVDAIVAAHRTQMEQKIEQAMQELEANLRAFEGL